MAKGGESRGKRFSEITDQVEQALGYVRRRDPQGRDKLGDRSEHPDDAPRDAQPSEELVADARMREREIELTAELEQARAEEVAFEGRYGATFEEFQAKFDPEADADLSEYYLEWSRAAEKVRMLRYELARLAERRSRRGRHAPAAPEETERSKERDKMS